MDIEKFVLDTETKDFLAKLAEAQAQASSAFTEFMSSEQARFDKAHSKMEKYLADAELSIQQGRKELSDKVSKLREESKLVEEDKASINDVKRENERLRKQVSEFTEVIERTEMEMTKEIENMLEKMLTEELNLKKYTADVEARLSQMSRWIIDSDLSSIEWWKAPTDPDSGVISDIYVKIGDIINEGSPLYSVKKGFFKRGYACNYTGSDKQLIVGVFLDVGSKLKPEELIFASIKS